MSTIVFSFSPVRDDRDFIISVEGQVICVDGVDFDFTPMPDNSILPASAVNSEWFTGSIKKPDGVLHVEIILPHGVNAPVERRFPEPITYEGDGVVELPEHDLDYEVFENEY